MGVRTTHLDLVARKKVGCGMDNISSMSGIVVSIARMVICFNNLQPVGHDAFAAPKEGEDTEPLEGLHGKIAQWPEMAIIIVV